MIITTDSHKISKEKKNINVKRNKNIKGYCSKKKMDEKKTSNENCQDTIKYEQLPIDCKDEKEFQRIDSKDKECSDKINDN